MICTRPDIVLVVRVVSRFIENPGREHWSVIKKILRYIRGTSGLVLCFEGSKLVVKDYVDSKFASE